jgi:hypothetical protein
MGLVVSIWLLVVGIWLLVLGINGIRFHLVFCLIIALFETLNSQLATNFRAQFKNYLSILPIFNLLICTFAF